MLSEQTPFLRKAESMVNRLPKANVREMVRSGHGYIRLCYVPTLQEVMGMNHSRLLRVLRYCPSSYYFGGMKS